MLRSARRARLEARATVMQPFAQFLHTLGSRASTPLDDVVRLMARHCIKRVPVLDGDPLVGIVSRAGLLRALVHMLDEEAAPTRQ